jgi:hypothetical protein
MSSPWRAAAESLAADLARVFGDRLRSVCVYGSHVEGDGGSTPVSCVALVSSLTTIDLDACSRALHGWHRQGLATPLLLSEQEFARSLDAFPLEYAEMQRAHTHVYGRDPFDGVTIAREDFRRACETQVKSHLLHLREEYLEAAGRPLAVADLVLASAPGFAALVRNIARLHGVTGTDRATVTRQGARLAGIGEGILAEVLALERPDGLTTSDPARLFPEYLAAVEQLARFVDGWRA